MGTDSAKRLAQISSGNLRAFGEAVKSFFNPHLSPRELLGNMAMGLSGEAGEVTDLIKKHLFHNHDLDKTKLKLELGDVAFYWIGMCLVAGLDPHEVLLGNTLKLTKRYPDGFKQEDSLRRRDENG